MSATIRDALRFIKSKTATDTHANSQIANSVFTVVGNGFQQVSPNTIIGVKALQLLTSGQALIHHSPTLHEKFIHLMEALLSGAQFGIAIYLLFKDTTCLEVTLDICKAMMVLEIVYDVILGGSVTVNTLGGPAPENAPDHEGGAPVPV